MFYVNALQLFGNSGSGSCVAKQASPLGTPEEVAEEFLFLRSSVVLDHQSQASSLVLVPLVWGVVGLQPVLHLTQSAVHLLVFISAMEEHHLSAKPLLHGVPVQGGLGQRLGDVVAVFVALNQPLPPLGVGSQGRGLQVESLNLR